jgi:transposase-like protein/IS1 family transposase
VNFKEKFMVCHNCQMKAKKFGRDRKGNQRYRCARCSKTFQEAQDKPLNNMYLPVEKAVLCLQLLVEGNSIRSTERITGVNRNTILDLLVLAGEKCERLLNEKIKGVAVNDVQCDEMWGFVGMKKKTAKRKQLTVSPYGPTDSVGDAWTFVALERDSKLVITWHLGKRTLKDATEFAKKLEVATVGRFQLTTDAFRGYPDALAFTLGTRIDFARLVKVYKQPAEGGGERRYSPADIIRAIPTPEWGNPDPEKICTSHVERQNLNIRMAMRRFTRLTNAFSKKWENLRAALALYFAYYNFCRIHSAIRCTPAIEAGIAKTIWTIQDLLAH